MTVAKRNKRVKPDPDLLKLADSLLANYQKPEVLIGESGLLKQRTKMLVERALESARVARMLLRGVHLSTHPLPYFVDHDHDRVAVLLGKRSRAGNLGSVPRSEAGDSQMQDCSQTAPEFRGSSHRPLAR